MQRWKHFICWKPLTIITKSSILDIAAVLDPPLLCSFFTARPLIYFVWYINYPE